MSTLQSSARQAADWIASADGLVIAAGAGMGVDSGLPDFRGTEGFWKAYPALGKAGIAFESIANPDAFRRDAGLAWGFYGHRLALYRRTVPHVGFHLVRDMGDRMRAGAFVFTSNVDGQFQRAGFDSDRIVEIHGSIHHLQCQDRCRSGIWSAGGFEPQIDQPRCQLLNSPPRCPHCGAIARPNILMFEDWQWLDQRTREQQARYSRWRAHAGNVVTVELGAGTHVATVRRFSETTGPRLIRINPQHEPLLPRHALHLRVRARAGIEAIFAALVEAGVMSVEIVVGTESREELPPG